MAGSTGTAAAAPATQSASFEVPGAGVERGVLVELYPGIPTVDVVNGDAPGYSATIRCGDYTVPVQDTNVYSFGNGSGPFWRAVWGAASLEHLQGQQCNLTVTVDKPGRDFAHPPAGRSSSPLHCGTWWAPLPDFRLLPCSGSVGPIGQ